MSEFWSRIEARQTLRTARNFEHERIGAQHVDEIVVSMLQVKQKDAQPCSHESIENSLEICAKIHRA